MIENDRNGNYTLIDLSRKSGQEGPEVGRTSEVEDNHRGDPKTFLCLTSVWSLGYDKYRKSDRSDIFPYIFQIAFYGTLGLSANYQYRLYDPTPAPALDMIRTLDLVVDRGLVQRRQMALC